MSTTPGFALPEVSPPETLTQSQVLTALQTLASELGYDVAIDGNQSAATGKVIREVLAKRNETERFETAKDKARDYLIREFKERVIDRVPTFLDPISQEPYFIITETLQDDLLAHLDHLLETARNPAI